MISSETIIIDNNSDENPISGPDLKQQSLTFEPLEVQLISCPKMVSNVVKRNHLSLFAQLVQCLSVSNNWQPSEDVLEYVFADDIFVWISVESEVTEDLFFVDSGHIPYKYVA